VRTELYRGRDEDSYVANRGVVTEELVIIKKETVAVVALLVVPEEVIPPVLGQLGRGEGLLLDFLGQIPDDDGRLDLEQLGHRALLLHHDDLEEVLHLLLDDGLHRLHDLLDLLRCLPHHKEGRPLRQPGRPRAGNLPLPNNPLSRRGFLLGLLLLLGQAVESLKEHRVDALHQSGKENEGIRKNGLATSSPVLLVLKCRGV